MTDYTSVALIEIDGASCALEILRNSAGHARFTLHHRDIDRRGQACWAPIHTSGVYANAEAARVDGLLQWKDLREAWLGGMTIDERAFFEGDEGAGMIGPHPA